MGFSTCVVASNEAVAKEIFKAQDLNFSSRPEFGSSEYFIYRGSRFVTAQYGEYWRFMKKLSMTRLLSVPQLRLFADVVDEEKVRLIESAARCATDGRLFDLSRAFTTLTNNTICRMAMSTRCSGTNKDAEEIAGLLKKVDLFGYGKKLQDALWKYDGLMEEIMKDYEEKFEENDVGEKDVMDILVETYRDDNAQVKLTRTQIKHFIIEIFFAGVDTTAATIQFAIAELINNPQILTKLRQEIDAVVGTNRVIRESDVPNLPYLQAIVKETLRKHPAGPLLRRQCNVDTQVNGYTIKAGTRIIINAYAIMRDAETWHDPDEFEPERFLQDIQMDYKGRDCLFMPFGGGRRACPGAGHGLMVTHSTVGALVQCFDWRVKGGMEKVDIKLVTGYSGAMASPLVCYPVSRLDFSKILDE
ncbi:3,9-dihydroxypterocarpan 6A-monooxygenase [Linum grandiflorum]